ncbi:tyrosine-type recombinase/integrase [Streptococcus didelphis]|uniref:Tyrosine-type recombinase/integrase n=1 Tax=Streptococcus didelphis TaxID=102886 RepID=A0ABY9LG52_9STRE|nr:tyrosine-type recombinase/integrase [Streptococcus didelphis]WMB27890.1 tyrosine-type recombinase/integrase [Streptococcus didelphis]WMB29640.1 tyrosine-type recombinase/integrase [Streptococcus didelphis]
MTLQEVEFVKESLEQLSLEELQGISSYIILRESEDVVKSELKILIAFSIIRELGITPIIIAYGARHTYGSVKVQEGVPLEVLAKWFGHKDTSMLRSIYIHLLDETKNEWFEREKLSGGQTDF